MVYLRLYIVKIRFWFHGSSCSKISLGKNKIATIKVSIGSNPFYLLLEK